MAISPFVSGPITIGPFGSGPIAIGPFGSGPIAIGPYTIPKLEKEINYMGYKM